jgi:SAM-dependent methyltransferase
MKNFVTYQNDKVSESAFFEVLRKKWKEIPVDGPNRLSSIDLLNLNDEELSEKWKIIHDLSVSNYNYPVRGWYHDLYRDVLKGKKVLDIGSGFGIDGIAFAKEGSKIVFADIIQENLEVIRRICNHYELKNVDYLYIEDLNSLKNLNTVFDVIWSQGSLINAPFEFTKIEANLLLEYLPIGGRWIQLAYPKKRWEKDGKLPFEKWGEKTDGKGTPWVEWYDLAKVKQLLSPAQFDTILSLDFYHDDFNWFDLIRRS